MTMNTKRFLYSVRSEAMEIHELETRIGETRRKAEGIKGTTYDKPRVQKSPEGTMENTIANVLEYEEKLRNKINHLALRRKKAQELIETLEDSRERQVLEIFFLSDSRMRMIDVADEVGYSERRAYDIYRAALSHLPEDVEIE